MESNTPQPPTYIPDLPPEPPQWPKVVGIISICWGGLNLLCNACMPVLPKFFESFMPPDAQGMPMFPKGPMVWIAVTGGVLACLICITAGALSISRNPATRPLHLAYGIIAIIITIFGTYMNLDFQKTQRQWIADNPDNNFAKQMSHPSQASFNVIGLAFGVAYGTAYPIFCIAWYGAVKRKAPLA
jgi:hypothetical protein